MQREVYSLFIFCSRLPYWAKGVGSLAATIWGTRYRPLQVALASNVDTIDLT